MHARWLLQRGAVAQVRDSDVLSPTTPLCATPDPPFRYQGRVCARANRKGQGQYLGLVVRRGLWLEHAGKAWSVAEVWNGKSACPAMTGGECCK
jgi:hypothetical protein